MNSPPHIPAVERVLHALGETGLPRPVVLAVVRRELAALRAASVVLDFETVTDRIRAALASLRQVRLQRVINGTGVVIHTNLGRAPLGSSALAALASVAANYNNLEFDLASGERGNRGVYVEFGLAVLCGAEAATVVNNCAAALVLLLRHFTAGPRKQVIISRGELVQIGGGFRVPEILESTGAELREVGTTNKTTLTDYARAVTKGTALILKVHRSNFFMGGFVESPATEELSALARRKRIPCIEDLGSGAVVDTGPWTAGEHEPTPAEVIKRGVGLVCFSGDKLLGGPQAGIIAGRAKLVAALKREPFFRALRCDKLILSTLQATVDLHLENAARQTPGAGLPALEMLNTPAAELRARAGQIVAALAGLPFKAAVGTGKTQVGGGTLPRAVIESVTVNVVPDGMALADFAARLRAGSPPLLGRVSGGCFKLDLRTVFPAQDPQIVQALKASLKPAV